MRRSRVAGWLVAAGLALGLGAGETVAQQPELASKEENIRELMRLLNADQIIDQLIVASIEGMAPLLAQVLENPSEEAAGIFREGMTAEFKSSIPEMVDAIMAVYADAFTEEEVEDLLAFYRSPTGTKVLRTLPQVMEWSLAAGQRWSEEVTQRAMPRIIKRLEAAGYRPRQ